MGSGGLRPYAGWMISNGVPTIQGSDVQSHLDQGWTLLDVRTDDEWAQGRIPGSVHIPMDELIARIEEVPEQAICVCAVGGRSVQVTQYLTGVGREAVNLDGGVYAWAEAGRPLEDG